MEWSFQLGTNFRGIIDTTLREGLQFQKANFNRQQQLKIFDYLQAINVDYVEVWNPAIDQLRPDLEALVASKKAYRPALLAHIRNNLKDLDWAITCRVDGVNILCTADLERIAAMRMSFADYLQILQKVIQTAQNAGLETRVSVEDFFHQPASLVREIFQLAENLEVNRLGVADTKGTATFWQIVATVQKLRAEFSTQLEMHLHNDLGQAVSNSLAALSAGANWIDTSLCGIGERTGITPLSSLLLNLHYYVPQVTGDYRLQKLTEAENYLAEICGIEVPLNLLTNRENGFAHKAGIHLDAINKFGPQKYEFISPGVIGNQRRLVTESPISGKARLLRSQ